MALTDKRKESMYKYARENLKRVPLDVTKEKYDEIKAAAETAGESVNGYIKKAVDLRMMISPEDAEMLSEKYLQGVSYDGKTPIPVIRVD